MTEGTEELNSEQPNHIGSYVAALCHLLKKCGESILSPPTFGRFSYYSDISLSKFTYKAMLSSMLSLPESCMYENLQIKLEVTHHVNIRIWQLPDFFLG